MNTEEYLDKLATEEKRTRLLADLEEDPKKKKALKRTHAKRKKLLEITKRLYGSMIETADAKRIDKAI